MGERTVFDSSEYHRARENFDGYCLGCGAKIGFTKALFLTKSGDLRQSKPPISLMVCNHQCKRLFIEKSIQDWSKIRDQAIARDNFTCQDCHRSYNIKFKKVRRPVGQMPTLSDVERNPTDAEKMFAAIRFETVWKLTKEILALEVHHIIPISDGGDEFDLNNLVTLCFDCHHLGRHGSKFPTPEERTEERARVVRERHICLDRFVEANP
jgi:hypothetical protein